MISATYFGEITELESRAVWYSDEEDEEDDSMDEDAGIRTSPPMKPVIPQSHETLRSSLSINFRRLAGLNTTFKLKSCIISQSSSEQFKNFKLNDQDGDVLLGLFGNIGRAIVCPIKPVVSDETGSNQYSLWLSFNSDGQTTSGPNVCYVVEILKEQLYNELGLDPSIQLFILSKQFSNNEQLEYLTNYQILPSKLPFRGQPMGPPSLIRNNFESAFFEQLTLSLKPATLVCLPDPKNCWFDKTSGWPTLPDIVLENKLTENKSLEQTLIFT